MKPETQYIFLMPELRIFEVLGGGILSFQLKIGILIAQFRDQQNG